MRTETYPTFSLAEASADTRAAFIRKTYTHLAMAVLAFIGLEILFFTTGVADAVMSFYASNAPWAYFVAMGVFVIGGWMASGYAHRSHNRSGQYAALMGFVTLEALFFILPLAYAMQVAGGSMVVIQQAGIITLGLFLGLTAVVFTTKKDFSFLGSILKIAFPLAIGLILAGFLFGFSLGLWFSGLMVALAAAAILYDTSKVLHEYQEDQYVGASLELFASLAMLFWYILRIAISLYSSDD